MPITSQLVESLLYEDESPTLDFKRSQYAFGGATNNQKAELLKDILAFANTFRRADAYILIGVEEVKEAKSKVCGIRAQLDDGNLQQFVNGKTQRQVAFSYHAMEHEGLSIAVIRIPLQERPLYLKEDYGRLKRHAVYLRRGSSTAEATPDEIKLMGRESVPTHIEEPTVSLELFDRESGKPLDDNTLFASRVHFVLPRWRTIPDYSTHQVFFDPVASDNANYYRDVANYIFARALMTPISLRVQHLGGTAVHDLRLIIEFADSDRLYVCREASDMPTRPKEKNDHFFVGDVSGLMNRSETVIGKTGDTWRIECRFGKVQPHATAQLEADVFIGSLADCDLTLLGKLYADNIHEPQSVALNLVLKVEQRAVTVTEIKERGPSLVSDFTEEPL